MSDSLDEVLVYERYVALNRLATERLGGAMGGRLLLYGNVDADGAACAIAANISGAATLGIAPDKEALKLAVRSGFCDFLVNSLDEALRILKNEIRKKQPVSVCLEGRLDDALREMAARGVQPDILALTTGEIDTSRGAVDRLLERGAVQLPMVPVPDLSNRGGVHWGVADFPALWLPKVDAVVAAVLGDELRGRWLRLAPKYLGRRAHSLRYVEMTAEEVAAFMREVRRLLASGELATAVILRFGGREEYLAPSA